MKTTSSAPASPRAAEFSGWYLSSFELRQGLTVIHLDDIQPGDVRLSGLSRDGSSRVGHRGVPSSQAADVWTILAAAAPAVTAVLPASEISRAALSNLSPEAMLREAKSAT